MKALIVYYSLTGTTRAVAEALAKELPADIEEIRCTRYRPGFWVFVKGIYDSAKGRLPPIDRRAHEPSAYDLVVIGAPIWASHAAPPIRTYLQQEKGKLPGVAFLLTHGGSPAETALREMEARVGRAPKATLVVRQADVKSGRFGAALAAFAATLRKGVAV